MCFRESDGKFLWQAVFDKLDNPNDHDNPMTGIASAPVVEGDRLYFVSNRCQVVCADVAGDPKTGKAKILWTLDMIKELKVLPRAASPCSPLIVGDLLYVVTSNGVDITAEVLKNQMRRVSSRSTRKPAKSSGRTIRPARTSWKGSGATPSPRKLRV